MSKKLLIVGLAMFLSACVATVDNQFRTEFPLGKVYRDKVTMSQGDVILPPGDWVVLSTSIGKNNTHNSFGSVALGRIDAKGYLRGFTTITSPLDVSMRYSFYSSSFCDPQMSMLYHQTNANVDLGYQSCFAVKKKTISAFSNFEEYVKAASSNMHAMNIDRPYDMLSAEFRITRGHKFLIVEYGFDYREDAGEMAPGYDDGEKIDLPRAFFPTDKTENAKAVVRWAKANADRIQNEFLD